MIGWLLRGVVDYMKFVLVCIFEFDVSDIKKFTMFSPNLYWALYIF